MVFLIHILTHKIWTIYSSGYVFLVSPSSPEHVPTAPMESPSQRYEARIEEGKLYYDKRW